MSPFPQNLRGYRHTYGKRSGIDQEEGGKNSFSFRILRRTWYCATAAFGIIAHSVTIIATSVIIVVFIFILVRRILCVQSRVCLRSTCCLSPRLLSLSLLDASFSTLIPSGMIPIRRFSWTRIIMLFVPPLLSFPFPAAPPTRNKLSRVFSTALFFSFPFFYTIFHI